MLRWMQACPKRLGLVGAATATRSALTWRPRRVHSALRVYRLFIVSMLLITLGACADAEDDAYTPAFSDTPPVVTTEYLFGVHPLHNPQHLFAVFGPLMDFLSEHIPGARFKLEASRNYAAFDKKLYAKKFHFALPNPFQTISAVDKGYRVFGKMGDDHNFRGIILVRKDSGITKVSDLKGKSVSYPAPTALAATMLPQYYLQTHGLDVMQDVDNRYVGSQESAVMNVFLKQTHAGATWPPPWRALSKARPELKAALKVIWRTDPLPNNGLVVLSDVPDSVAKRVHDLMVHLHEHERGQRILEAMQLSRFENADNATYQPVRDFIKIFEQKVRPLR
jgi:phosphonate transport system substrate-binding protein